MAAQPNAEVLDPSQFECASLSVAVTYTIVEQPIIEMFTVILWGM